MKMPTDMNNVAVQYKCGCWERVRVRFIPHTLCGKHGLAPAIVRTHEWRVRCPECTFGRWHGQDEKGARIAARNHRNNKPTHMPSVAYDRVTDDGKGTVLTWDLGKRRSKIQLRGPVI